MKPVFRSKNGLVFGPQFRVTVEEKSGGTISAWILGVSFEQG